MILWCLSPLHRGNDINLCFLLHGDQVILDTSKDKVPHLVFEYTITTNQFYSSSYFKPLTKKQTKLHNEIIKLHELGWGYTKIHRHLREKGFQIGKSRTTVDSIIKKMKKRHEYLSQPIIDGIGNFRIKMMKMK